MEETVEPAKGVRNAPDLAVGSLGKAAGDGFVIGFAQVDVVAVFGEPLARSFVPDGSKTTVHNALGRRPGRALVLGEALRLADLVSEALVNSALRALLAAVDVLSSTRDRARPKRTSTFVNGFLRAGNERFEAPPRDGLVQGELRP